MNRDLILFTKEGRDHTFEDLLLKIYENSETKQQQILATVQHVTPMIETLSDAMAILPLLTSLQETAIRNDDALIKMAAIVQRSMGKAKQKFDLPEKDELSDSDWRQQLMDEVENQRKGIPGSAGDE